MKWNKYSDTVFLTLRYSKGRSAFLRFMSLLSTAGVTIGVAALIVVLSVMSGVREALRDKILGITPHILVIKSGGPIEKWEETTEKIRELIKEVKWAFPLLVANAILKKGELTSPAVIQCIPERFVSEAEFRKFIKAGEIFGDDRVNVGKVLSKNLALDIGDEVTIISPYGETTLFGFIPNILTVKVGGITEVGIFDWDSVFVFMNWEKCQQLFDTQNWVSSIAVMLENPDDAEPISYKIMVILKHPFIAIPWTKTQKNLFAAIKLEKLGMTVVLALIIIVASFNILSTVSILVKDKSKDIAIMKVFGIPTKTIRNIFLGVGIWMGIKGIFWGTITAFIIVAIISKYGIVSLPEDVYFISNLPVKLEIQNIAISWGIAIIASLIASLIPADRATKKEPFEILRKEL